jgi:uncharacterized DUF497 family protein
LRVTTIVWLDEILEKLASKHGVGRSEVREIFSNKPFVRFMEKGHRDHENVYAAYGKTDAGRRLIVFFIFKSDGQALVVSAREMTVKERKHYEKAK